MARKDRDGLYQRPQSPYWWATYTDRSGQRVRRSTRQTDRREAEAVLAQWRLDTRAPVIERTAYPFEEMMLAYLQAGKAEKRPNGYQRDIGITRHLRAQFGGLDVASITPVMIREYVAARRGIVADGTINRELCVLSAAINYARTELEWPINNSVTGRKPRPAEGRVRWLTREEADRLIETARLEPQAQHLADFIMLALNTGCRRDELLRLEWRRVDLDARLIHLDPEHTKTARRRSIPLNADAMAAMRSRRLVHATHCPTSPWVFCHADGTRIGDVKHGFGTACRRAGIEDFRIHDLRHTCAAWLVTAGVTLQAVRDLLGHTTIKMTERYAHLAPENVRAAVAQIESSSHSMSQSRLKLVEK